MSGYDSCHHGLLTQAFVKKINRSEPLIVLKHEYRSRTVVASSRTSRWISLIIHIMSAMRAQLPWKRYEADVCELVCLNPRLCNDAFIGFMCYVPRGNTAMKPRRGIASRSVNALCTTTSFINICQGADHLGWSVAESAIPICMVHTWERCWVRSRCEELLCCYCRLLHGGANRGDSSFMDSARLWYYDSSPGLASVDCRSAQHSVCISEKVRRIVT